MSMQTLFQEADSPLALEAEAAAVRPAGPFAAVALEQGIDHTLDYAIPPAMVSSLCVGQLVRVPLGRGNRPVHGYVIGIQDSTAYPKIKSVLAIEDQRVLIGPKMMDLARWMSRYYVAPLGAVLDSVLPSAVRKRIGLGYTQVVRLALGRDEIQAVLEKTRAPKRRAILARLLLLEPGAGVDVTHLATEAGATVPTVRKLVSAGLITITPEADLPGLGAIDGEIPALEGPIDLNEDQRKVFDDLRPRISDGGFSVNLLLGVTGSGKTEVYLRSIREALDRGRGAIVLVPEIALTPQTVRRFTARFGRVAVLHSGLGATQRHRFWQQISTGRARVVVGARSAVFAPVPNLGVIVVDEEHEASYKQDQSPRYNARDVAIKRAQIEGVPVLLGSATPSLETYYRVSSQAVRSEAKEAEQAPSATSVPADRAANEPAPPTDSQIFVAETPPVAPSTYHLLTMPHRVRGLSMPHVERVDMATENRMRKGVHLISQRLEHLLRTTLESGHQAILLLNRRGYSNFVYCSSCAEAIQCKYCDATVTYHRSAGAQAKGASNAEGVHTGHLHCHYCLAVNPLPDKCPNCSKKLSLFGLGTQRVEEELARKFPELKFARVDSDSMRNVRDYESLLGRFARREIQVMLGTQMIAKGLDYPNVTLVGVISGDTALALPDFRAAERTFQLITQVAGRAGRGDAPGRVVLQTFLPDDPTIQAAIRQDYLGFAKAELVHRRQVGFPPFARMVRILLRDQEPEKLNQRGEELAALLAEAIPTAGGEIRMRGPMPCAISRIAGYWRNQIVMICDRAAPLQRVLAQVRGKGKLVAGERVAVDVDPVSLL